jgi:transcriptional regulator GlxA family with amidase domain
LYLTAWLDLHIIYEATTHWKLTEEMRRDGTITVMEEMSYVRDGYVVTAQGGCGH